MAGLAPQVGLHASIAPPIVYGISGSSRALAVGPVGDTEHYRDVKRHRVRTDPEVLLFRIDENLYFPNAGYLEDALRAEVAANRDIRHVVLVCSSVSLVDASALETLVELRETLKAAGITLHLAEVRGRSWTGWSAPRSSAIWRPAGSSCRRTTR